MDIDRGSDDYGFDFRLWVVGHGSWSDGPMVVGGGLMVRWSTIVVRWAWVVGMTV